MCSQIGNIPSFMALVNLLAYYFVSKIFKKLNALWKFPFKLNLFNCYSLIKLLKKSLDSCCQVMKSSSGREGRGHSEHSWRVPILKESLSILPQVAPLLDAPCLKAEPRDPRCVNSGTLAVLSAAPTASLELSDLPVWWCESGDYAHCACTCVWSEAPSSRKRLRSRNVSRDLRAPPLPPPPGGGERAALGQTRERAGDGVTSSG